MAKSDLVRGKTKDNSRKTGAAAAKKVRKRAEAEARNAAYQKLPLEQKLARNSIKVKKKLVG